MTIAAVNMFAEGYRQLKKAGESSVADLDKLSAFVADATGTDFDWHVDLTD